MKTRFLLRVDIQNTRSKKKYGLNKENTMGQCLYTIIQTSGLILKKVRQPFMICTSYIPFLKTDLMIVILVEFTFGHYPYNDISNRIYL